MALATWSAFEVIRVRLGGLAATVFLVCSTFYIRIHCTGLFMTEQLGLLYSLCAVAMLVESLAREGKAKASLYCVGLFFITQALNARPAAYMTLPFLVLASWELCQGNFKVKGRMVGLSAVAVATALLLHSVSVHRSGGIAGSFQRMVLHLWVAEWRDLGGWPEPCRRAMARES